MERIVTTNIYYGTKRVEAWPEQRQPVGKDGLRDGLPVDGYGVRYSDGYVSWSPKEVFEAAYQPLDKLSFGHAMKALVEGRDVKRKGSRFRLKYDSSKSLYPIQVIDEIREFAEPFSYTPRQEDILANDWMVVL